MESVGIGAALQSMRFIFRHQAAFIRLVVSWAVISLAVVALFSLLARPAGVTFAQQLSGFDKSGARLLGLIPSVLGNLVVSVSWVRYIVLDEEPRNPVAFRAEMGSYFGRSIQIGVLGLLAALPGVMVAFIANSALGSGATTIGIAFFIIFLVVAFVCALAVYARLQVMLAVTALGDTITLSDAFELTRGRTPGLVGGWLLSYLLPFVVLLVAQVLTNVVSASGLATVGAIAGEFVSGLYSFATAALLAGFTAYVLLALDPRHGSDKIAREFT